MLVSLCLGAAGRGSLHRVAPRAPVEDELGAALPRGTAAIPSSSSTSVLRRLRRLLSFSSWRGQPPSWDRRQTLQLMEMVPLPMCMCRLDGEILCVNDIFHENINGNLRCVKNVLEIISPQDYDRFYTIMHFPGDAKQVNGDFSTKMISDGNIIESYYNWTVTMSEARNFIMVTGKPIFQDMSQDVLNRKYESYSQNLVKTSFAKLDRFSRASNRTQSTEGSMHKLIDTVDWKMKKISELKDAQLKYDSLNQTLETKRTFVRHVSHEIRTPLNIVTSGLELLASLSKNMSADMIDIIADMRGACAVAIDILNDLLTYEKLDSDLLVLEKTSCDISELMTKVYNMFHIQAKQAEVNIELDNKVTPSTAAVVEADSAKLAQVFRNLISNALKFTKRGGTVKVGVSLDEAKDIVRIEVHDTGVGMSKEQRRKLFKEVVQFNAMELQNGQGSGLGLYLSRKIIDMHRGVIGVDMDWEGPGSIFFVELPLSAHGMSSEKIRRISVMFIEPEETNASVDLSYAESPLRLLIVDDSPLVRKYHRRTLSAFNVMIDEACDGFEAIDAVRESIEANQCYDAILMDASMPTLDGMQASKRVRELGFRGKIFGVTGNAFQSDIDDFINHGADEVVIKPVSLEMYSYIIRSCLRHDI